MVRKYRYVVAVLSVFLIAVSVFGYKTYTSGNVYKIYLQNQYQRSMYDLVSDVNNLQVSLSKVLVSNSREQGTILYGDIWREASSAHYRINALPISNAGSSNIVKFLSQISDFSYAMLKANTKSAKLSDTEYKNIEKLRDYCGYITLQLNEFIGKLGNEGISYDEMVKNKGAFTNDKKDDFNVVFQNMSDQIQQYPSMIYDGPFSENVLNIKPMVLKERQISVEEAEKTLYKIFPANSIENILVNKNTNNYKIPAYSFSIKLKGRKEYNISIDLSKNGGHILYMLDTKSIPNEKISIKEAANIGMKFLKNINFPNMIPTYTLKYDGIVIANYVTVKNKTLLYPDQIKLKIALDDGSIVGIESQQYLIAHQNRKLPAVKISATQAQRKISDRLKIDNVRLTLIPLESLREVLCYEFYGDYEGEKYFIYVNAKDGSEERILKVINTSSGELTM